MADTTGTTERSASPASSTPRGSGCSRPGPTPTTWRSGSARRR
jgi:hypothetical protein